MYDATLPTGELCWEPVGFNCVHIKQRTLWTGGRNQCADSFTAVLTFPFLCITIHTLRQLCSIVYGTNTFRLIDLSWPLRPLIMLTMQNLHGQHDP